MLWILSVVIGARFLARLFVGHGGTLFLWVLLLLLVSLQAATVLRPVIDRAPGSPLFERDRLFFFEHLNAISRAEDEATAKAKAAAGGPGEADKR